MSNEKDTSQNNSNITNEPSHIAMVNRLSKAAMNGDTKTIERIIRGGLNPNTYFTFKAPLPNNENEFEVLNITALHIGIIQKNKDVVKTLLELGANANSISECSRFPYKTKEPLLNLAAGVGNNDAVRLLLQHEAYINGIGYYTETLQPDQIANESIDTEMPLANQTVVKTFTALELASANGHWKTADILDDALKQEQEKIRRKFYNAAKNGDIGTIRKIVTDRGFDPSTYFIVNLQKSNASPMVSEVTALHIGIIQKNNDVVKTLLALGANPNSNSFSYPPSSFSTTKTQITQPLLNVAAAIGNNYAIDLLLQNGADPFGIGYYTNTIQPEERENNTTKIAIPSENQDFTEKLTASEIAFKNGHHETVAILEDAIVLWLECIVEGSEAFEPVNDFEHLNDEYEKLEHNNLNSPTDWNILNDFAQNRTITGTINTAQTELSSSYVDLDDVIDRNAYASDNAVGNLRNVQQGTHQLGLLARRSSITNLRNV